VRSGPHTREILLALSVAALLILQTPAGAAASGAAPAHTPCRPWRIVPVPEHYGGFFVSGSALSDSDVWAVGGDGYYPVIDHWDGASWSEIPSPRIRGDLYGVAGLSPTDAWAVGVTSVSTALVEHWDGTAWSLVDVPEPGTDSFLYNVNAVSVTDVWAVGNYNQPDGLHALAEHWDGTAWTVVDVPDASPYANVLNGVAAISSSDVWAVGYQQLEGFVTGPLAVHWDGSAWTVVDTAHPPFEGGLQEVDGVAANDAWTAGGGFQHWNGTAWGLVRYPGTGGPYDVSTLTSADAWAVGSYIDNEFRSYSRSWHWDGARWRAARPPNPGNGSVLSAVAALSSTSVWAFGEWLPPGFGGNPSPLALHSDGPCE
jgi:hypothetical protein